MRIRRWACAGIVAGTLAIATPAWSQTYVGVTPPAVVAEASVVPKVAQPAPVSHGSVAVTGADIAQLVAIGALGISAGSLGLRLARRRVEPLGT